MINNQSRSAMTTTEVDIEIKGCQSFWSRPKNQIPQAEMTKYFA